MKPNINLWLNEAKNATNAHENGMYLLHNGVVRKSAKAKVRQGIDSPEVIGMNFSYDENKLEKIIQEGLNLEGIYYLKVWLNSGKLTIGDDLMYVLIGGDTRPHVIDGLQKIVSNIKENCVREEEIF